MLAAGVATADADQAIDAPVISVLREAMREWQSLLRERAHGITCTQRATLRALRSTRPPIHERKRGARATTSAVMAPPSPPQAIVETPAAFSALSRPREECASAGGWVVRARKGAILATAQRAEWERELGVGQLPCMLFGDNALELTHDDGALTLRFDARGALRAWAAARAPPLRVAVAASWSATRAATIERLGTTAEEYDWTFSTTYTGEIVSNEGTRDAVGIARESADGESSSGRERGEGASHRWEEGGPGLDMAMLTQRDPILFFHEAVLYEDELDDNGVTIASVKVRVMPTCWFVLFRFWLRVDGVLLRLREARVMATFGGRVVRECTEREESWAELEARGKSPNPTLYRDPDEVARWLKIRGKKTEILVPGPPAGGKEAAAPAAAFPPPNKFMQ